MRTVLLIIITAFSYLFSVSAQENIVSEIKSDLEENFMIGNYHEGQKYIIAIPPNGREGSWGESTVRLSISSKTDANLNINILGSNIKKSVKAGETIYLDENSGLSSTTSECREYNTKSNKSITIEADMPVSVYVLNAKSNASDSYKAIPVEFWGNEYRHCSYYDNGVSSFYQYSNGFLIIGSEKGTNVTVKLQGRSSTSNGNLKNDASKTIGDIITFKLNEGEVYQIAGNGETKGSYDLTGTQITSTKPVGVISYHEGALIPALVLGGIGKHLSEMLPPVNTLGTHYASLSMVRNGSKKGDMFRMLATEDNTNVTLKWYDFDTKELLGSKSLVIAKAGDFEEYSSVMSVSDDDKSITGISVFEATKPIQLMQYSYTRYWDDSGYDSFMWLVPPTNQYTTHAIVQAPDLDGASENHLHLLIKTDPEDKSLTGLKSVKLDGQYLDQKYPTLLSNKVPGTSIYWAQISIATGSHDIQGDGSVEFGAYVQSKTSFNNYGSASIMAYKPENRADTMAPKISIIKDIPYPKKWKVRIEENRKLPGEIEDFYYEDTKVWFKSLTLLDTNQGFNTVNFKEPYTEFEWKFEGHDDYIVNLDVEDTTKYAEANFYVADYVGNIAIGKIQYYPNTMSLVTPQSLDFGKLPIKETKTNKFTFKNSSEVDYMVKNIYLSGGSIFSIVDYPDLDILKKDSTLEIEVVYAPISISNNDKATLTIVTDNLTHTWDLTGSAFSNEEILVFEGDNILDFGKVTVDDTKNKNATITNNGQTNIDIESVYMKNGSIYSTPTTHDGTSLSTGNSTNIEITYAPTVKSDMDRDTLVVKTSNAQYVYPVKGIADPKISVMEIDSDFITVSPNPIQSEANITINLQKASDIRVNIFANDGQHINKLFDGLCNQGEKNIKLDANGLASGVYTLVIELNNNKYTTQVVIAK